MNLFFRFTSAVYYPARKFLRTSSSQKTTARVTTFFFPLFSLSGVPHGRFTIGSASLRSRRLGKSVH